MLHIQADDQVGLPQHGLSSNNMALITSDCVPFRPSRSHYHTPHGFVFQTVRRAPPPHTCCEVLKHTQPDALRNTQYTRTCAQHTHAHAQRLRLFCLFVLTRSCAVVCRQHYTKYKEATSKGCDKCGTPMTEKKVVSKQCATLARVLPSLPQLSSLPQLPSQPQLLPSSCRAAAEQLL